MRMKKTTLELMAIFSLVACSKSMESGPASLSANAVIEDGTKTVYVENGPGKSVKVSWAENDSFKAYYDKAAEPVVFRKTSSGTTFSASDVPQGVSAFTAFKALYGSAAEMTADGKISIDFSKQGGSLDGMAAYDVMTAESVKEGELLSFAFKHNCAVLRLKCVNHTAQEVDKVELAFHDAAVGSMFSATGMTYNKLDQLTLSFTLSVPVAKGSSEYGKGTVEYRYAAVPAMQYHSSGKIGLPIGDLSSFTCTLELNDSKSIVAGNVYDVTCDAGAEESEGGGFWGD